MGLISFITSTKLNDEVEGQYETVVVEFNEPVGGDRMWTIVLTDNRQALVQFDLEKKYTITGASIIMGSPEVECFLVSILPSTASMLEILPKNPKLAGYVSQTFSRYSPLKETRHHVVGIVCQKRILPVEDVEDVDE